MDAVLDIIMIVAFVGVSVFAAYLMRRITELQSQFDAWEKQPVKLDESSVERIEELVGTANKARKDLGHQVGLARVAIRDVSQAATSARAAAPRNDRKW